jgi:periplasmic protein TonB
VSDIRLPLGLSVAGHVVCLVLLILLLPTRIPPPPEPPPTSGVEVVFAPSARLEEPPIQPPVQPETAPPEAEPLPPPPEEPVAAIEPPPPVHEVPVPVVEPPPPPAPRKPVVKRQPRPAERRLEQPQPNPVPAGTQPSTAAVTVPQAAYAPTPAPSAEITPGYRALLSAWLERHKHYPDSARQRGEEGRAVLRFAVDRSGRVVDFAVAQSSGFPDLDASIEEMMRGALLPPFPASMTQPRIDVSVTIRFSLSR